MADNDFDRVAVNTRERPLSTDINKQASQADRTLRELLTVLLGPRSSIVSEQPGTPFNGFMGDGFKVRQVNPAALQVQVAGGFGFIWNPTDAPSAIGGVSGIDDLAGWKPLLLTAAMTINVPTPDPTNPRIDIVEVNYNRRLADPSTRDVLNPVTGVFDPTVVNKTLAWDMDNSQSIVTAPADSTGAVGYKAGIPGVSPSVPPTTAGYTKIAQILVGNGVTTIAQNVIQDLRQILAPYMMRQVMARAELDPGGANVSLPSLKAPAGVQVAANILAGARSLFIFAGDVSSDTPIATCTGIATETGPLISTAVTTVTSGLQTSLANAAETDPVLQVAVGQPVIKVDITGVDDDYFIQVGW